MKKVAVHSVPRSGSTWLGEILNSSRATKYCFQPLFSYELKGFLTENSDRREIDAFFARCLVTQDDFMCRNKERVAGVLPTFLKDGDVSHTIYKEARYANVLANMLNVHDDLKAVCLIRNPLAVLASWLAAPSEFDPSWSVEAEWMHAPSKNQGRPEEFHGFGRWLEATDIFLKLKERHPDRVLIVKYSDLLHDLVATVAKVFDFAELDLNDQTEAFLRESRSRDEAHTYSVFRAAASDEKWRDSLGEKIVDTIRADLDERGMSNFLE